MYPEMFLYPTFFNIPGVIFNRRRTLDYEIVFIWFCKTLIFGKEIWCKYVIIRCKSDIHMIFKDEKIGQETLLLDVKMELFGKKTFFF